jgi:hypothetical protein
MTKTFIIKLYTVTTYHEPSDWTSDNLIGVVEGGWDDWLLDTPVDSQVFYFMDQDEFDALGVGQDITGDSDVVVAINREPEIVHQTVETWEEA